jgi:hypothetical protein
MKLVRLDSIREEMELARDIPSAVRGIRTNRPSNPWTTGQRSDV